MHCNIKSSPVMEPLTSKYNCCQGLRMHLLKENARKQLKPRGQITRNETRFLFSGFPKVLPAPGTTVAGTSPTSGMVGLHRQDTQGQQIPQSPQPGSRRQSRNLECLVPPRTGSFRQRNSPVHQPTPTPLAFCKRRLSWPEVDPSSKSG